MPHYLCSVCLFVCLSQVSGADLVLRVRPQRRGDPALQPGPEHQGRTLGSQVPNCTHHTFFTGTAIDATGVCVTPLWLITAVAARPERVTAAPSTSCGRARGRVRPARSWTTIGSRAPAKGGTRCVDGRITFAWIRLD